MNILILSAGRRVSLMQQFKNAIMAYYPHSLIYTGDSDPTWSPACHMSDKAFLLPKCADPEFADAVQAVCLANEVSVVIPTTDLDLSALCRLGAKHSFLKNALLISDESLIEQTQDKLLTPRFFGDIGIAVPRIFDIETAGGPMPLILKPRFGSNSAGVRLISDMREIEGSTLRDNILQEYISDDYEEYSIDAYFSKNGILKCAVPRKRLQVRGGEVSKSITSKSDIYDKVLSPLSKIRGAKGVLTIQVFYNQSKDDLLGLECNARFGGGAPLSIAAGADFASFVVREYLIGECLEFFESWTDGLRMTRYDQEVFF